MKVGSVCHTKILSRFSTSQIVRSDLEQSHNGVEKCHGLQDENLIGMSPETVCLHTSAPVVLPAGKQDGSSVLGAEWRQ